MGHAELFVHAGSNGINRGGATDFVIKFGGEFFATLNDLFAFLAIWIPGVFLFGAGFLTKGGDGDLRKAVFNNFITWLELVFFPEAKFAGGFLDGFADFGDLLFGEREIIDLLPFVVYVAIILSALSDKKMKVRKLLGGGAALHEAIDNLDEKLVKFLPRDGTDFEMV